MIFDYHSRYFKTEREAKFLKRAYGLMLTGRATVVRLAALLIFHDGQPHY